MEGGPSKYLFPYFSIDWLMTMISCADMSESLEFGSLHITKLQKSVIFRSCHTWMPRWRHVPTASKTSSLWICHECAAPGYFRIILAWQDLHSCRDSSCYDFRHLCRGPHWGCSVQRSLAVQDCLEEYNITSAKQMVATFCTIMWND